MDYSTYQHAIFTAIESGSDPLFVQAVAGSGKTTTIVHAMAQAAGRGQRVLALAFNKSAAAALTSKLPATVDARTAHSFGLRACKASGLTGWKIDGKGKGVKCARKIVDQLIPSWGLSQKRQKAAGRALPWGCVKVWEKIRLNMWAVTADTVDRVIEEYEIKIPKFLDTGHVLEVVTAMAAWWVSRAGTRTLDFADMVWYPSALGMSVPSYDLIFVDEAQDLSAALRALVGLAVAAGARPVFVGDRYQAIYGFAGADTESVASIIEEFGCEELPLSICYRCPQTVIALAQVMVPTIEARTNAPEGVVETIETSALLGRVQAGDLVLSRLNAPNFASALTCLAAGTPARIAGRDLQGKVHGLVEEAYRTGRRAGRSFQDAVWEGVNTNEEKEVTRLTKRGAEESTILDATDIFACVRAVCGDCTSMGAVEDLLDRLFRDAGEAVLFSSIHRAKGAEAPRVFVREDRLAPAEDLSCEGFASQEINLRYVAVTRAQETLIFVKAPEKK